MNAAAARRAASHTLRRAHNSAFLQCSRRWNSTFDTRKWSTPLARTLASAMKVSLFYMREKHWPIPIAAFMRQVLTSPEGGYYTSRPETGAVFGKHGDFVTSPEISQVFGELIGVWTIAEWMSQGRTKNGVQLMEVGPGKGTLMDDMLRTFRNFKSFSSSVEAIYLVEASATLRQVQKNLLCGEEAVMEETDIGHRSVCKYFDVPVIWVEDIRLLPHEEGKTPFIFAHEFFDALPIHAFESVPPSPENQPSDQPQTIMTPTGPQKLHQPLKVANTPQWRELLVTLNPQAVEEDIEGEPEFQLTKAKASTPSSLVIPEISKRYRSLKSQPGSTIEVSPESRIYAADFARRIGGDASSFQSSKRNTTSAPQKKTPSGAALIMDYGTLSTIPINSLRGIQHHKKVPPLSSPGQVDVSADVDFTSLAEAAIEGSDGVEVHGPVEQGDFLNALGITERMEQLLRKAGDDEHKKTLETGWKRLVEKSGGSMGQIYKVMTIVPENGGRRRPVGFGGGVQM
ncbi:S-adenosyl-L-methionine-dependent methyltransferase MidA [Penicillium hispanicum]|uniref:S-adenosyl-L-methionine-dependent methyltransferase MidA n=1 Tax=Penicillium hispanicum TaxID=1080232 RepID=UPI002540C9D5|nr:S-adenosyl-L-methionine-dependent methyltransferase MidA [Penicillium hispanicum]KAJ5569801.1 S-adenosyl-L-methionine-dependent methyltransferase MidA [Penicillium hispanicum]